MQALHRSGGWRSSFTIKVLSLLCIPRLDGFACLHSSLNQLAHWKVLSLGGLFINRNFFFLLIGTLDSSSIYFLNICSWVLLLLNSSIYYYNKENRLSHWQEMFRYLAYYSRCSSRSILLNLIQGSNSVSNVRIY